MKYVCCAHAAVKGILSATFLFSFWKGKCPQNGGSHGNAAHFGGTVYAAKDSAASDAEPFAVAGTVPHIRQVPRPKRPGWRSIFFFMIPTTLVTGVSGALYGTRETKHKGRSA